MKGRVAEHPSLCTVGCDLCCLCPSQAHLQAPPVATAAAAVAAAAASVVSTTPQSLKLTYPEILDRIKEEFQFLQNQYHR